MSDAVLIAIVGVVGIFGASVLGPAVLGFLNARAGKQKDLMAAKFAKEKEERDNRRQDLVAERAAKAAEAAAKAAAELVAATKAQSEQIATAATAARIAAVAADMKLNGIHTLVDGSLTRAMQAELDATIRELAVMKELVALRHAQHPGIAAPAAERAIELTEIRVAELAVALEQRHAAIQHSEDQAAVAAVAAPVVAAAADTDRIVKAIQQLPGQNVVQGAPIVTTTAE